MKLPSKIKILLIFLIVAQLWVSTIQQFRYSKDFACAEMSEELEGFLEKCGLNCDVCFGFYKDTTPQIIGVTFNDGQIMFAYRNATKIVGHAWLIIKLFGLHVPYDATLMLPVDPRWYFKFDVVAETKGFYNNGKYIGVGWIDKDDIKVFFTNSSSCINNSVDI